MTIFSAIICQGRSGSNYLQYLLDSHPQISFMGELFHPDRVVPRPDLARNDDPRLDYPRAVTTDIGAYLEERLGGQNSVSGFKMPWDWLLDYPDCWGAFRQLHFRLIHLRRRNRVDQFVSVKLAQLNSNWLSTETYQKQEIEVVPEELRTYCTVADRVDLFLDRMCSRYVHTGIVFEDLIAGRGQGTLLDFLGVGRHSLQPATVRSRTRSKREVISNFDALMEEFQNHPIGAQLATEID